MPRVIGAHRATLMCLTGRRIKGEEALKDETVKKRFADLGAEAVTLDRATPEALQKYLTSEIAKWGPIIKKAGVYAD